jgi:uncharacterized repeat protein (TIGR03943 family)
MDERTQGALLLATGGIAIRLGFSDVALAYVKSSMQPFIALAGLVLVVLGVGALWRTFRGNEPDPDRPEGGEDHAALHGYAALPAEEEPAAAVHSHTHGPASAWLLVVPLLALLLIAPPALGSFAAERQSVRPPAAVPDQVYPPLPDPTDGAVELSLRGFVVRALYDEARSLEGQQVRLVGFVSASNRPDSYHLTRFVVNCCAADATAVAVEVVGDQPWPSDTWLVVEGSWEPRDDLEAEVAQELPPLLRAETSRRIQPPTEPYET